MNLKKKILGLAIAFGLLFSIQLLKTNSEAQVGSYLASKVTDNVHVQRGAAAGVGLVGGMEGRWAAGKIGAAIGTAIAPGIGTVVGGVIGAM